GSELQLKVVVNTGYKLGALTVTYDDGTTADLNGSYKKLIAGDVTISAVFEETEVKYRLDVVNGTVDSKTFKEVSPYSQVTVAANDAPEGKEFLYWAKDSEDGAIVSFEKIYSFKMTSDLKLVAVFGDETAEKAASVTIDDANDSHVTLVNGRYSLGYSGRVAVPEGCTVTEYGIVLSNQPAESYTAENFVIGGNVNGVATAKIAGSSLTSDGQFKINVNNVKPDSTRAARAYLTYTDASGASHTIYSNTWSVLTTAA
ncbi:MAG: hypothetical protein K6F09_03715, partial [Clostridiales bacterium]|nr:hypothetical protein [Clostridiales bacterium]